ncbi:hypothetical protein CPB84DRAFT_1799594 [Gymnopilus junonius]|uniref:F-box domain-containing protein n=1 Tax=Gymnopilus junonius TaxID=109634 RepID=A0A9P5NAQ4_GYMJU|nr:hypothetical protein CPB84DRAFT_1799594 [Gymnopilus junonius]
MGLELAITHLISSNLPPSIFEKQVTRTVIENLNSKLHSFDVELAKLVSLLEETRRARAEVHDTLRMHQAILHPVRTLPPEILSKIFIHCLPDNNWNEVVEQTPNRPTPSEAPLLLTQICRSWRTIALGTSRLWTTLKIDIRTQGTAAVWHRQRIFLPSWITRSGRLPLVVSIFILGEISYSLLEHRLLREILAQSSHRWKELHWICYSPRQIQNFVIPFLAAHMGLFPALETCSIVSHNAAVKIHQAMIGRPDMRFFATLPKLRKFRVDVAATCRWSDLPLHRLTSLCIGGDSKSPLCIKVTECFQILTLCPHLEAFSVSCGIADYVAQDGDPLIEHLCLKVLRIVFLDFLFKRLALRVLQFLDLWSLCPTNRWGCRGGFTEFVEHTNGSLRHVTIRGAEIDYVDFMPSLRHCQNVRSLVISVKYLDDAFLSLFKPQQGAQLPLEHLTRLQLTGVLGTPGEVNKPSTLNYFRLRCRGLLSRALPFLNGEPIKQLMFYRRNGLDCQVDAEVIGTSTWSLFAPNGSVSFVPVMKSAVGF